MIPLQIRPTSPNSQTKNHWRLIWHLLKAMSSLMKFLVLSHLWRKISHCIWWNWQKLWWKRNPFWWGKNFYLWWLWTAKIIERSHKSCDCDHQVNRHSKRSALFITLMDLGWIIFCAMKTQGSYIILVKIFYQLLIQTFIFSRNIYLTINNMITTTHLIIIFLPSIVHILNLYFAFINPS